MQPGWRLQGQGLKRGNGQALLCADDGAGRLHVSDGALARHPAVALPRNQIDCGDDELLREDSLHAHIRQYRRLSGALITSPKELINLCYDDNRGTPVQAAWSQRSSSRRMWRLMSERFANSKPCSLNSCG